MGKIKTETYFEGMKRRGIKRVKLTAKARELIAILVRDFFNEHEMCQAFEEEIRVADEILKTLKKTDKT